jgi:hypothetical protein
VRATALAPPPARPATGRDYLLAKLGDDRAAEALHAPLAALAADACRRPPRGAGERLRGAYLVERGAVDPFRAAVQRLQASHPDMALVCTGPWPPYSFAA